MSHKTRSFPVIIACLLALLFAAACQAPADHDIRGAWDYTMTAADGNTYDAGTITFSGEPGRGTYLEVNIYAVEYTGDYRVNGSALTLTGTESWEGTLSDASTMSGTWQHEDGTGGTWTATRRQP